MATDYLFYSCTPEADLDDAFMAGKGAVVEQTCITPDLPRTMETLAAATGHEVTPAEWATFNYKWFTVNDPDRVLFTETPLPSPIVPAVPLMDTGLMLLSAIIFLWLSKSVLFTKRQ